MRTRIKICGITRIEDARAAARLGADAIGLVFHAASARAVSIPRAREIAATIPPLMTCVGVFLNADKEYVREVLASLRLDLLQFHGEESAGECGSFGRPYIKAVALSAELDFAAYASQYPQAAGFLLDGHQPGQMGGLGVKGDWSCVPRHSRQSLILAGGLDAGNVAAAVRDIRPYGLDVSSGVESAKGIKDAAKIKAFINEVRCVDCC